MSVLIHSTLRCTALPAAGVLVAAYVSSQRIDSLPAPLQQRIRAHLRADSNEATESIAISKLVAYNIDSWFSTNPVSLQGLLGIRCMFRGEPLHHQPGAPAGLLGMSSAHQHLCKTVQGVGQLVCCASLISMNMLGNCSSVEHCAPFETSLNIFK